jgi:endonuclease/exonuclease/phosphatase family metal-dependent hydrolase
VHKDGTLISIVVTHTQAQYGDRDYHEIRQQQIDQLITYIKRLDPAKPVVLAGDFNTSPTGTYDGKIYADMTGVWTELTRDARSDCLNDHNPALADPLACGTHYENDRLSNEWIDYVFTRLGDNVRPAKLRLIRNEASDQPFSDHEGVDAELLVP